MPDRDSMSLASIRLEFVCAPRDEIVLRAIATGFLWRTERRYYLVSNLHNFSGWNHEADKALSETGALPTHVIFKLRYLDTVDGTQMFSSYRVVFPLFENGAPSWFIHPDLLHRVDVAALPLGDISQRTTDGNVLALGTIAINDGDYVDFEFGAGDDAYVIGFPKGLDGGKGLPIWKRASVATEPSLDLDDLPVFLVDTATRQGMSGSPVLAKRRGVTMPRGRTDLGDAVIGEATIFAGVYSGRLGDDELGVQLGKVWKSSVVEQIISSGLRDTHVR
jgi:hypothetical protein